MRILDANQVHFQPTDIRFGPSKIRSVIAFIAIAAFFSIFFVVTIKDRAWGPLIFVSILCGIFLLVIGSWVAKAFSKDGWGIAIQNSAILLKADIAGKEGQNIIEIEYGEIISVRKLREKYNVYKKKKNHMYLKQVRSDTIDIELTTDAFARLTTLASGVTVGLDLSNPNRLIYPAGTRMLSAPNIITLLQKYCRVEQDHTMEYEKPDMDNTQQVNEYILLLVRRGHKMDAQRFARKAFGFGLGESKDYVAKLLKAS